MATIAPIGRYIITDSNGNPLVGGKVNTYESGTTTPKVTYTTQDETTANANPVILDSDGSADIWLGDGGYKFVVTDADDVVLFTTDNLGGNSSAAFGNAVNTITGNTPITDLYANSANVVTAIATLSLLSVSAAGEGFYLTVSNTSTADVTIDPDGAELIDGAATAVIESGKSCLIICDGTEWFTFFLDKLIDLPAETTSIDQDDFITYAKAVDGTEYKVTARNFYAFTIDDVSNFNDAPAADDKLIMVNVSNGNANSVEYADLMSIDNLTEDATPTSGDFFLSYDTSAGTAKKVDFDSLGFDAQSPAYDSGNQTYTAGSKLTLAHGLGYAPLLWKVYLVCTTAEDDFSIGDIIEIGNWTYTQASTASYNYQTKVGATNFEITSGASGLLAMNDSSTVVALTAANFKLRVVAY